MTIPFTLPDWVPAWVSFALVVIAALFLLAFLLMPFSVFGLKGRLEGVEARLDEIQGEIRSLALRLPEPGRVEYESDGNERRRWAQPDRLPPIPPRAASPTTAASRRSRSEPRFDPG